MSDSDPPLIKSDPPPARQASYLPDKQRRASSRPGLALARLTDVRKGEGAAVFGAFFSLAGIIAAHVALETARDAFFLTQLRPTKLAFVYLVMALIIAVIGRIQATIDRALGHTNALILTLMATAIGTMAFFVAEKTPTVAFGLYLWVGLCGTLLLLQFWLFTAARFSVSQGRRVYGLIAAGGVLGAVVGGSLSTLFTSLVNVDSLLAVASAIHLLTALLLTTAPEASHLERPEKESSWQEVRAALRSSPYVKRIVLLTFVSTLTLLLIDYNFKTEVAAQVPPAEIGQFLATYYTGINALALLIQLVLAMQVLQRMGTVLTLSVLPLLLLATSLIPLSFGALKWGAVLTRGADGSLRHSLHKVSSELLFLPLSTQQRTAAKRLLDSLVARGTQGITALVLLGLTAWGLDGSFFLLAGIGLGAFVWFCLALSLRRPYLAQFRNLMGQDIEHVTIHLDQLSLDSVEVVVESLSSSSDREVLSAMSLFEEAERTGLIPALLLYHPSAEVLLRALRVIPSRERKDWRALTERLMSHADLRVRLSAARALGSCGYLDKLKPDAFDEPELVATAAFFQADLQARPENDPKIRAILEADQNLPQTRSAKAALLDALAVHGSKRWAEVLLQFKGVHGPRLARPLADSMARVGDPRFIPSLIELLKVPESAEAVRRALLVIGQSSLDALCERMSDQKTAPELQRRLPLAIARFNNQAAADYLLACLSADFPGALRFKVLQSVATMDPKAGGIRFSKAKILPRVVENGRQYLVDGLLIQALSRNIRLAEPSAEVTARLLLELLLEKQGQGLDRMTRLLQLIHPRENMRRVYHTLMHGEFAERAAAAELLEVLTLGYDEDDRRLLREVFDASGIESRIEQVEQIVHLQIQSEVAAVRLLLETSDPALSALAAEYATQIEMFELTALVQDVMENNPWLKQDPTERGLVEEEVVL